MRRIALLTTLIAASALVVTTAAPASAHDSHASARPTTKKVATFTPVLTGDQEVGIVGSARGKVTVTIRLNPRTGSVSFRDLTPTLLFEREDEFGPTNFHIHRGAAGVNGPVVLDLTSVADQGQTSGRIRADKTLVREIAAHPESFYVNYHTISHPKGAVRGQLAAPKPAAATFSPVLTGDQEIGIVGSARGKVTMNLQLDPATGTVSFRDIVPTLLFEREDEFGPTNLHIHRGAAGVNGPVVIDLTAVADQGQTSGSVHADPALVAEIAAHPADFYVNYHTISHPKGAVRGQLSR